MSAAGQDQVRWGILGPGRIAIRFAQGGAEARNATIGAVASRDKARATEFAARFRIPRVHATYEELLADSEIDAVYIATPNSYHHPMTLQAIAAGKHVLCEKPYTRRPAEVDEAFDAAATRKLILMEAFMWRHTPMVRQYLELLPEIGEIHSIRSTFSFALDAGTDVRLEPALEGGALMDVGCYCVSASRLIAGEPVTATGEQRVGPSGVDVEFAGLLTFPSGLVAQLGCGFTTEHRTIEAIGSKTSLRMVDPWLGQYTSFTMGDRDIPFTIHDPYQLEIENMSDAITGRGRPLLGREDSLGQARTIAALYASAASGKRVSVV